MTHASHRDLANTDLDVLVALANTLARPCQHAAASDPIHAALALGESLGFERPHALHVATLTLSIFDQLVALRGPLHDEAAQPWSTPRSRVLLHVAALLHDVGCTITYAKHHKHSFDIIRTSRISGLDPRENMLCALTARYHRRSEPKSRHTPYSSQPACDRELVRFLASILRLGDALDRSHTQIVRSVAVSMAASTLVLTATAPTDPRENLDACIAKGRMLEKVFGVEVAARWGPVRPHSPGNRDNRGDRGHPDLGAL